MGNSCETYCAYEEPNQLSFMGEHLNLGQPVIPKKKLTSRKTVSISKQPKTKEEKCTYWLRGLGAQKYSSPVRARIRPFSPQSRHQSPVSEEKKVDHKEPEIRISNVKEPESSRGNVQEDMKQKKSTPRKQNFPIVYVHNIETDQNFPQQSQCSSRMDPSNDLAQFKWSSSKRRKGASAEDYIAANLNNQIGECLRAPPLAQELIHIRRPLVKEHVTEDLDKDLQNDMPKRIQCKDACTQDYGLKHNIKSVQTDDQQIAKKNKAVGCKSDVSTSSDVPPLKVWPISIPQQVVEEESIQASSARVSPTKKEKKRQPKPVEYVKVEPHQQREIDIDPDEEILLEGDLQKFKPGFEKNFIARWIQLSTRSFRYYKNHYHSICYLTRPISAIPLQAIAEVNKYEIQNQQYKRREKEMYSFMFEIVLKQDYEDIFFFREYEINGMSPTPGSVTPNRSSPNRSSSKIRSRSITPGKSEAMRSTYQSPTGKECSISQYMQTSNKVTRIIQGHLMPIRDLNKGLPRDHYLEDQEIIHRDFGQARQTNNGQQTSNTWTSRQNEWYNSERRFIFSCKNVQERKMWIAAIKKAIGANIVRMKEEAYKIWEIKSADNQNLSDQFQSV